MLVSEFDSDLEVHGEKLAPCCAKGRHGTEAQSPSSMLGQTKKTKNHLLLWQNLGGRKLNLSLNVAVSLWEPMLECNIEWARRGVAIWEDNGSEGTMAGLFH